MHSCLRVLTPAPAHQTQPWSAAQPCADPAAAIAWHEGFIDKRRPCKLGQSLICRKLSKFWASDFWQVLICRRMTREGLLEAGILIWDLFSDPSRDLVWHLLASRLQHLDKKPRICQVNCLENYEISTHQIVFPSLPDQKPTQLQPLCT